MANEIKATVNVRMENGLSKDQFLPAAINITQSSIGYVSGIVSVGTAGENLAFPDISTLGVLVGRNLDGTNYVELGLSTSTGSTGKLGMKILAGEPFFFRLKPGINVRAKANTAAVDLERHLYEA